MVDGGRCRQDYLCIPNTTDPLFYGLMKKGGEPTVLNFAGTSKLSLRAQEHQTHLRERGFNKGLSLCMCVCVCLWDHLSLSVTKMPVTSLCWKQGFNPHFSGPIICSISLSFWCDCGWMMLIVVDFLSTAWLKKFKAHRDMHHSFQTTHQSTFVLKHHS